MLSCGQGLGISRAVSRAARQPQPYCTFPMCQIDLEVGKEFWHKLACAWLLAFCKHHRTYVLLEGMPCQLHLPRIHPCRSDLCG